MLLLLPPPTPALSLLTSLSLLCSAAITHRFILLEFRTMCAEFTVDLSQAIIPTKLELDIDSKNLRTLMIYFIIFLLCLCLSISLPMSVELSLSLSVCLCLSVCLWIYVSLLSLSLSLSASYIFGENERYSDLTIINMCCALNRKCIISSRTMHSLWYESNILN